MRHALIVAFVAVTSACGARGISVVQSQHAHEFSCDRRYVRVERVAEVPDRWVSRGCSFEAQWDCRDGECELVDARAHGVGAP